MTNGLAYVDPEFEFSEESLKMAPLWYKKSKEKTPEIKEVILTTRNTRNVPKFTVDSSTLRSMPELFSLNAENYINQPKGQSNVTSVTMLRC